MLPAPKPLWGSVVRSLEDANSNCRECKLHRSTFFFFAFCLHILSACPDPAVLLCCCVSATLRSPVHPAPALLADDSCLTLMPVFNLVCAWRARSKTPLGLVQLQSWCSGMVPPVIPSQERQGWLGEGVKPGISLLLFNLLKLHFPRVDLLEFFFLHAG